MTHTLVPKEPTEAELLPCPFCGTKASLIEWKAKQYRAVCPECGARAESTHWEANAIGLWNRRTSASKPDPDAVVLHFHHATTPPVKPGSMQSFIVLTEREGRKASFAAHYLNQYPLEYEDGCEAPECAEGKHEDGCPTTGWFYDESNFDYDHCYFRLDGTVLAWAPIPEPDEIIATKSADDAIKALVEAANSAPHHDECDLFVLGTECSCYKRRIDAALRPFLKEGE